MIAAGIKKSSMYTCERSKDRFQTFCSKDSAEVIRGNESRKGADWYINQMFECRNQHWFDKSFCIKSSNNELERRYISSRKISRVER